jgi:hypothetical protein
MKSKTKIKLTPLWLRCLGVGAAAGALLMGIQPASAVDNGPTSTGELCMQNVFGSPVTQSNKLNCTANDIRLSKATSVSPSTCTDGETINLTATFETIVTANARYDAGFYFRIDGGGNARGDGTDASGICSLSKLTPGISPALNPGDGDTCGDLNSGTYNVTFTIPGVLCQDSDGDGFLNLPNCTSWHSNANNVCNINSDFDFDPDNKSKCVCDDTFQVPVIVEQATLTVAKSASPTQVSETGGTVTYTVNITNNAQFVSVEITSIIDTPYGDVGAGDPAGVTDNTCPDLIGDVLAPGGSTSCSFKFFVSGDSGQTITDTVEACGDQTNNGNQVCDDDDADVTITDVSATPTLTKTATAAANCHMDVSYTVTVSNNSAIDTLTVNSLNDDKFGDLTNAIGANAGNDQVVSTDCATGGTIAVSDNYTCNFVGRIIDNDCTINHTNTATGGVTDDDGVQSSPSDSANVTAAPSFQ